MIARISGTVIEQEPKALIVDVGGLGYRVTVPASVHGAAAEGSTVTLRIYHHQTSESESLFGFSTSRELELFELLLSVPSVGPKTAIGILEVAPLPMLQQAVAENDTALLTKVAGVGKRTAERVIVELKEKIGVPKQMAAPGSLQHETVEALVSIGFSATQARQSASRLPKDISTVEEAVKVALQQTSRS